MIEVRIRGQHDDLVGARLADVAWTQLSVFMAHLAQWGVSTELDIGVDELHGQYVVKDSEAYFLITVLDGDDQ